MATDAKAKVKRQEEEYQVADGSGQTENKVEVRTS